MGLQGITLGPGFLCPWPCIYVVIGIRHNTASRLCTCAQLVSCTFAEANTTRETVHWHARAVERLAPQYLLEYYIILLRVIDCVCAVRLYTIYLMYRVIKNCAKIKRFSISTSTKHAHSRKLLNTRYLENITTRD